MEGERAQSSWGIEALKTVFYALLLAIGLKTFVFQPFNIPSSSMEDTLLVGDFLFVSKFAYGYSNYSLPVDANVFEGRVWAAEPQRGDVVVFRLPVRPWEDYIKRVVGLPGDRVQMIDGVLHINGAPCKLERVDDYVETTPNGERKIPRYRETLPNGVTHFILDSEPDRPGADNTQEFFVPKGHYFMMGDNRDDSSDSRIPESGVGFVPAENLVGRADVIFVSIDGTAKIWEVWKWPWAFRAGRFFHSVE